MPQYTIIGQGTPADQRAIKLETKRGRWIMNEQRDERPPEALRAADRMVKQRFTSHTLRSISNTYNCVGLVFGSRRTWIDPDQLALIFEDDGYKKIENRTEVSIGDVIIYKKATEITHIGVVIEKRPRVGADLRFMILSKWGGDGEYIHHEDAVMVEYFGNVHEFFSEIKKV